MRSIDEAEESPHQKVRGRILGPLRETLRNEQIEFWCQKNHCALRHRLFDGVVVLFGCIQKHLEWVSLRRLEDSLAGMGADPSRRHRDGGAFCQARQRLSVRVFQRAMGFLGESAAEQGGELFHGLRVWMVDGSTSVLPNTSQLREVFGRPNNQYGASMLPLMRWVVLICQGSGAVVDAAFGPMATSELRLFLLLIRRVKPQTLILGDSLYCSYVHLAMLRQRGSHFLCPRQNSRKDALRTRLGRHDELHAWRGPAKSWSVADHLWTDLPETLEVRVMRCRIERKGYRSKRLCLSTSLLDPRRYPAEELVALYAKRWNIEGDIRHLKVHHGLDRLTAKNPGTVVREFYSSILAYNAVRILTIAAGSKSRLISHTRVRTLILQRAHMMAACPVVCLPGQYRDLLLLIGSCTLDRQERPPEPRVLVRDPRRSYRVIKVERATWKKNHVA